MSKKAPKTNAHKTIKKAPKANDPKIEKTWDERANEIGSSAMSSIRDMVAALECDYDRKEELHDELASEFDDQAEQNDPSNEAALLQWIKDAADENSRHPFQESAAEYIDLVDAAGECESREDAEQRIQEDPLSLQFRSGWANSKEDFEPEEFELLLSTGGPAVRIIGEIGPSGAERPRLQVQDWFKPWTEHVTTGEDHDALETYCRCFYMGE